MCLLVLGGDNIDSIKRECPCDKVVHWKCRNKSENNRKIPETVDAVIMFIDYLNHTSMKGFKSRAKKAAIPVYYTKRSCCGMCKVLDQIHIKSK